MWWWISWLVILVFYFGFNFLSNFTFWILVSSFWFNSVCSTLLNLLDYSSWISWGCTNLFNSTLLLLGSDKLWKSYRTYCRLYWNRSPSWYLLPEYIYLVLSLRSIYRLWHTLPHEQGIPYLYTYTNPLRSPNGHLCSHKVVALPGPQSGH